MMEVTPHLKTVLKNYQHSATKSLQGPGHQTVLIKDPSSLLQQSYVKDDISGGAQVVSSDSSAAGSPPPPTSSHQQSVPSLGAGYCDVAGAGGDQGEYFAPMLVQQPFPILTAADTTCSERTETVLEAQTISCFVVGGEKRLCLPQVLTSVLRKFTLLEINKECDQLQIYCSRCTPDQLNVLKTHGILPSTATSCGLITKTDAERLCSVLLLQQQQQQLQPKIRKSTTVTGHTFAVHHKCFGQGRGVCLPELYTGRLARCIECQECGVLFAPQQFVCHAHGRSENRTVHWGFDSSSWRAYMLVALEQPGREQAVRCLDDMWDRFEGRVPFPAPVSPPVISRPATTTITAPINGLLHKRKLLLHTGQAELAATLAAATDMMPQPKKNKLLSAAYAAANNRVVTPPPVATPAAAAATTNGSTPAPAKGAVPGGYVPLPAFTHHHSMFDYVSYMQQLTASPVTVATVASMRPSAKEQRLRQTIALNNLDIKQEPQQPNVNLTAVKKYSYFGKPSSAAAAAVAAVIKDEARATAATPNDAIVTSSNVKVEPQLSPPPPTTTPTAHLPRQQQHSPDSQSVLVDSTVSVVQSTARHLLNATAHAHQHHTHHPPRYNPEIELSTTDTDDTCSERSDRGATAATTSSGSSVVLVNGTRAAAHPPAMLNGKAGSTADVMDALRGAGLDTRERVITLVQRMRDDYDRELDMRDERVIELERRVAQLEAQLLLERDATMNVDDAVIPLRPSTVHHHLPMSHDDDTNAAAVATVDAAEPTSNSSSSSMLSASSSLTTVTAGPSTMTELTEGAATNSSPPLSELDEDEDSGSESLETAATVITTVAASEDSSLPPPSASSSSIIVGSTSMVSVAVTSVGQ